MPAVVFGCGCTVTQRNGAELVGIVPCEEHGGFSTVKKALSILQQALLEAHEQLPPGPPAAEQRRAG